MDKNIVVSAFYRNDSDIRLIGDLYCQIFLGEKYSFADVEKAIENINKHATYQGFLGFKAINPGGRLAGFAYGYQSIPGQFYREKVAAQLTEQETVYWLNDCFEFVELAVEPSFKRKGIGSLLHDRIMSSTENEKSVLTTWVDNQPAIELYVNKGWKLIQSNVPVISNGNPQVIMGINKSDRQKKRAGRGVYEQRVNPK